MNWLILIPIYFVIPIIAIDLWSKAILAGLVTVSIHLAYWLVVYG